MKWFKPYEKLPEINQILIIDCMEGVGEGYYKGKGVFRFIRYGIDVLDDDVYRWTYMPQHNEDL